ncbi:MAG: DNA polymerase III subunit delta' [bacterium]
MAFENIIGQHRVRGFFEKALQNGRISHAYLFVGERGVGKEAVAIELAKALLCEKAGSCSPQPCPDCSRVAKLSHPDLHFVFPAPAKIKADEQAEIVESVVINPYLRTERWANPTISIDRIREIRRKSAYKSFEGRGRVVIIVDAERMSEEGANSILKILEEPPEKMYLLMTSSRPNLLLPTIASRCQVIKFEPLKEEEIEKALLDTQEIGAETARLTARLASGSYRRAIELLSEDLQEMQARSLEFFRKSVQDEFVQILYVEEILNAAQRDLKKVKDLLSFLQIWFRDAMLVRETDGQQEEYLIYAKDFDVLRNFLRKFPNADLYGAVRAIEDSLEQMNRNVQINLILIVLLNRLRTLIRS